MTVPTTHSRNDYVGDGGTIVFPITFEFFDSDEIEVTIRDTTTSPATDSVKSEGADYTVSGGEGSTGSVTLIGALASSPPVGTDNIILRRVTKTTQNADLTPFTIFPAEATEEALDRAAMRDQEDRADLARAMLIPKTDTDGLDMTLPNETERGVTGALLGFDSDGQPIITTAGVDTALTTPFTETLLDDTNAAAARATLVAQEDVVTTRGDVVRGDAVGDAERLALGASGEVLGSDGTDLVWQEPRTLRAAFPLGYLSNLAVRIDSGDTDHDIEVSPYRCRDDGDSVNMVQATALTKQLDAAWAAGAAAGALAAGVTLSGPETLYIHALSDSPADGESSVEDWGIDVSQTAVNLLVDANVVAAGLDSARLIGVIRTDASDNIQSLAYRLADGLWQWVSNRIALSAATNSQTVTNPFSKKPVQLWHMHEWETANDGWAIGDQLFEQWGSQNTGQSGFVGFVSADGTTIGAIFQTNDLFGHPHKTAFSNQSQTVDDFIFVLHAVFPADAL